ncbi:hypothetical protein [Streptomyces sp. NPDC048560]|uniref:hypothetical protein n=1 Tax=Streptomyces sp. NPDC048560 TaxID=3155488 RepID=UPI003436B032
MPTLAAALRKAEFRRRSAQPGHQLVAGGAHIGVKEFGRLERQGRRALEERRSAEAGKRLFSTLGLWKGRRSRT